MRIRTANGRQTFLGYCANVHPGESLTQVLDAVRTFGGPVRRVLGKSELAFGLWLSRTALTDVERDGTSELRHALDQAGVLVCTMNGFPYGNFHAEVVKRLVYQPDLGTDERHRYLLGLARVLSELLPDDAEEGTISTLPIGHRNEVSKDAAVRAAAKLCGLCEDLAALRDRSGRSIRICLEPEPGCLLETTAETIEFFTEVLPDAAQRLGTSRTLLDQHLGVCFDTCHQAVVFEEAVDSVRALDEAGITIGKAQLSSALEVTELGYEARRAALARFDEPRFLHQVRARLDDGSLAAADDISETEMLPVDRPWRVHFHVPIHRQVMGTVTTTRDFLQQALGQLMSLEHVPALEVETYTWSVLPESERPRTDHDLVRGLAEELRWALGELT